MEVRSLRAVVEKRCVLPSWRVAPGGGNRALERAWQYEVPRRLVMFEKLCDVPRWSWPICLVAECKLSRDTEDAGLLPAVAPAAISRGPPNGHLRRRHA